MEFDVNPYRELSANISAQDFECLFYQCHNLVSLDLTNFDTFSVTNMGFMFYKCYLINK